MAQEHVSATTTSIRVHEKHCQGQQAFCKMPPCPRRWRRTLRNQRPTTLAAVVSSMCVGFISLSSCISIVRTAVAVSTPGSTSMVTLRVRMADGAVKRLQATPDDTVHALVDKLGMTDENLGLGTDATGDAVVPTASVASLRLRNGDFLYVKSDAAAEEAAKAKTKALGRIKAAAAGAQAQKHKFVPFPDYARPLPPRETKRVKTWQDVEAMQAQTFSLKPQKGSNVKRISIEQSAMDDFVGHLKETGLRRHRCALLLGRVSPSTKGIKVEAMYEPSQDSLSGGSYDSSALTSAAAAALAGHDDGGDVNAGIGRVDVADEVARAVRVAELLGLRVVGWCLSHDKRDHFMGARDVVTAAAMQLWAMLDKGKEDGLLVATVTVPVNQTDGEVATEAFSVSNQTVQMYSEGILADDQPDPTADRVTTTASVKEGGKDTKTPETLGMICNVAIVRHEGILQTRFPAASRSGQKQSLSALTACLFGSIVAPKGRNKEGQKQPSFLKRLSDFHLLVYLSRQMGFSRDFEELCSLVQKRDSKSPALGKLKVVLENLCNRDGS